MKRNTIITAVMAASILTVGNVGNLYAEGIKDSCRPLLSASYIVLGNVGSCVDPLVEICDKLGIEMTNGMNCPIIVIPGNCIPEVEISTEGECNTEDNCPETEVQKPECQTTEIVTTQQTVPESSTTESASENVTEIPNIQETTKYEEEITQKPVIKPEQATTQQSTTKPETDTMPEETTVNLATSYAEQVVNLVNAERAKAGLKALIIDKNIEEAALIRAKETEISFSHTRPNGSSFSTVLRENEISFRGAGENIAWGQKTPEQVMNGWMNSSGHRANILNPNFTKIGVGYYKSKTGRQYWTQLFTY